MVLLSSTENARLPLETLENVASFLWNDTATLSHCALACRSWYTAVRPLFFRRVVLRSPRRLGELEELLLKDTTVGQWIRELYICASGHDDANGVSWPFLPLCRGSIDDTKEESDLLIPFPGTVLSERLKRVQELTFQGLRALDAGVSYDLIRGTSQAFGPTVRTLAFIASTAHDGFLQAFMHSFPQLDELQSLGIQTVVSSNGPRDEAFQAFQRDHIPYLPVCRGTGILAGQQTGAVNHPHTTFTTWRASHDNFVHQPFVCFKSLRRLHTLEIMYTGRRVFPMDVVSSMVLPECGANLRTLTFSCEVVPERSQLKRYEITYVPAFSHLRGLEVLELRMRPLHHPFVISVLQTLQAASSHIKTFIFHVFFPSSQFDALEVLPVHFSRLDKIIENGTAKALRLVHFKYHETQEEDNVWVWVKKAFPLLMATTETRGVEVRVG